MKRFELDDFTEYFIRFDLLLQLQTQVLPGLSREIQSSNGPLKFCRKFVKFF